MARSWDLKSSVHPLTSFYQMILRSIYRRFSRQSKTRSGVVSQGKSLIFPSSFIVYVGLSEFAGTIFIALKLNREERTRMSLFSGVSIARFSLFILVVFQERGSVSPDVKRFGLHDAVSRGQTGHRLLCGSVCCHTSQHVMSNAQIFVEERFE